MGTEFVFYMCLKYMIIDYLWVRYVYFIFVYLSALMCQYFAGKVCVFVYNECVSVFG